MYKRQAVESNIPEHNFLMGALFSFQKNLRNGEDAASGGTSSTTFYNKPLFEVKSFGATETEWWGNLVEEMGYSMSLIHILSGRRCPGSQG